MVGSTNQLRPKTILTGIDTQASGAIEGDSINTVCDYPKADAAKAWNHLMNQTFVDFQFHPETPSDWYFHNNNNSTDLSYIRFIHKNKKKSSDNCYVKYIEAKDENTLPIFEFVNTGC
ncbi:hypothetical protein [Aliivibrio logei]|uniref:hypothetical protein n=1 Tax=Aliivibrio logei TaxID=688 RepID=UPI0035C8AAC1